MTMFKDDGSTEEDHTDTENYNLDWNDGKIVDKIYSDCLNYLKSIKSYSRESKIAENAQADTEKCSDNTINGAESQENNIVFTANDKSIKNHFCKIRLPHIYSKIKKCRRTSSQNSGNRRPKQRRLICRNGDKNVVLVSNVQAKSLRLMNDFFHTLIESKWRWILMGTVIGHFAIWLVFAVFWYVSALAHDDFDENPPPDRCVTGGKDFINIFLASVEAQTTIGFGDRAIDEACPESIFLLIMQLIIGTAFVGAVTSVIFAKISSPAKFPKHGVGFSDKAVVSLRDGQLCLMFRIWDLNHDHIVNTRILASYVTQKRYSSIMFQMEITLLFAPFQHFMNFLRNASREGQLFKHYMRNMDVSKNVFMMWPQTIIHVLDSTSPLYKMSARDLLDSSFEITVTIQGASRTTGLYTQSQFSYIPREIMWGYRFVNVVKYCEKYEKYAIDTENLNTLREIDTPLCSAQLLENIQNGLKGPEETLKSFSSLVSSSFTKQPVKEKC